MQEQQTSNNPQAKGALGILLIGDEGTGKTTSLRTLPPEETIIIQPNTKDLTWPGWENNYVLTKNLLRIKTLNQAPVVMAQAIQKYPETKYLIVEDTTHLQTERTTSQAFIAMDSGNAAFAKWNQFGADFGRLITESLKELPASVTVIFIGHTEIKEDGQVTIQTAGKLLDNSIKPLSHFTYTLVARVLSDRGGENVEYVFQTNHDGVYKAKTPMGCFKERFVPNDMKAVIDRIRAYKKESKLS